MIGRVGFRVLGAIALVGVLGYAASQANPWPSALLIRYAFDWDARNTAQALAKHVPADVVARLDVRYDSGDPDAYLDVYYPAAIENTGRALPTIVWVHGGAWISGDKSHIGNYLKILAGRGYTNVSVGYSLAPGATYPTPVKQVNAALAYLNRNAERLHVDASRLVLAGDSAGAQIAAQVANIVSAPSYAEAVGVAPGIGRDQIKGVILHGGAFDVGLAGLDGVVWWLLRSVLWSYSGTRDFLDDRAFARGSVTRFVTSAFPPGFISAGNSDPLLPQSKAMVAALAAQGVPVDTLFFPDDREPALPHEYQFNLDTEAGVQALSRSLAFLRRHLSTR